jgi:nitrate/nitrite transporter NarK
LGLFYLYSATTPQTVLVAYSLLMFSVIWAANAAYVVTSEILPLRNWATGLGLSVAAGRVGAFCAPMLLSMIYEHTRKSGLALLALTILTLPGPVAALAWCLKGKEGRNRPLEEVSRETVGAP